MNILVNVDLNDLKENEVYCLKPVENPPKPSPLKFVTCGNWVSVNDELPNEAQVCFIKADGKAVPAMGFYKHEKKCWEVYPRAMIHTLGVVTHWMPVYQE